ncbi:hypothetical protein [Chroococcidiopsis sp.]
MNALKRTREKKREARMRDRTILTIILPPKDGGSLPKVLSSKGFEVK